MFNWLRPKTAPDRIPVGVWIRYTDGSLVFQRIPIPRTTSITLTSKRHIEMNLEIHWHNVESSNLARVAWHENAGLLVGFKNDTVYLYPEVSREVFIGLLESNSKGRFFHAEIRDRFEFTKIDAERPLVDQVSAARLKVGAAERPTERQPDLGAAAGRS